MQYKERMPGIFGADIIVEPPAFESMRFIDPIEAQNQSFQDKALPQQHSLKDRGIYPLHVSPTNRPRGRR